MTCYVYVLGALVHGSCAWNTWDASFSVGPSRARSAMRQEGRDALTLEEFCRWFPSVLGLEPLSPQHIEETPGETGVGCARRSL